ncbi:MAG: transposase [Armatimonadetes bacterium]|nr:transposase [Armatimonadota bacterium]
MDCTGCPSRSKCIRSEGGLPRKLTILVRAHYEALNGARERMTTEEGKKAYRLRAGVEGSLSQGVRRCGLRFCRYRGLAKTHLQHLATAAGLNRVRSLNHLAEVKLAPTRQSRFARLAVWFRQRYRVYYDTDRPENDPFLTVERLMKGCYRGYYFPRDGCFIPHSES